MDSEKEISPLNLGQCTLYIQLYI